MSASKLDAVYRSILITKFFTKGWGKPDNLRRLFEFRKIVSDREECYKLIPSDYPITITKEEKRSDYHLLEGHFLTPLETLLPGVVPTCAQKAHFQVLMPPNWADSNYKPMCVHLAGTGDHFFWRRRNLMAKPLMKEAGIGAIILENPFYGLRKPQDQVRSSLHNVSDIFVMGGCLILETLVLLRWCERNGLGPLGVTGLSMGGHMASLAATNWPKPLVLVPCLSWSTASAVFTQGVMSNSINWELLETQFFSDGEYRNKLAKMVTIVDEAFLAGRKFAQRFSKSHNTSPAMDVNTFNLPAILNNTETLVNKIDITNPDNILSCQGFRPELNQKYSVINKSNETSTSIFNGTSLEVLKNNQQLSEDLYMKITSQKKFELESSEITQINEIAYQSMESTLNNQKKIEIEGTKELGYRSIEPTLDNQKSAYSENINMCNNAESELVNVQNQLCKNIDMEEKSSCLTIVEKDSEPCDNKITNIDNICDKIREVKDEQSCKTSTELTLVNGENEKNTLNGLTKSILSSIPFLMKEKEDASIKWKNREALQFMRGVMDECTHLSNFSIPYDTSLIIAVCAKNDAYVPREDCGSLEDIWPGAEVRYIDAGHVSAYVLHQSLFRSCIVEAFEKSKKKWLEEKEKV